MVQTLKQDVRYMLIDQHLLNEELLDMFRLYRQQLIIEMMMLLIYRLKQMKDLLSKKIKLDLLKLITTNHYHMVLYHE